MGFIGYANRPTISDSKYVQKELKKLRNLYLNDEITREEYEGRVDDLLIMAGIKWVDGG